MAAPEVRSVGAITSGTAAVTPAYGTGVEAGDLALMFAGSGGATTGTEANTALTASGWTSLYSEKKGNTRLTILWRILETTTDARTTNDTGDHQMARIILVKRGTFDPENPVVLLGSGTQGSTKSVSIPGGSTTRNESLVFAATSGHLPDATGTAEFSAWANAALESVAERIDNTVTAGDGEALGVASGIDKTAGEVGATTATAATAAERSVASIVVLPPANSTYRAEILKDEPLLYYPLGEASGTVAVDASSHGLRGTYKNSPTLGSTGLIETDTGTAVTLGEGKFIERAHSSLLNHGDSFTYEAWIKLSSVGGGESCICFKLGTGGTTPKFVVNTEGKLLLRVPGFANLAIGKTVLSKDTIYHVAATKTGGTNKVYVNGVDDTASTEAREVTNNSGTLRVGSEEGGGSENFKGVLDEFAIYGSALSAERILAHYEAALEAEPEPIEVELTAATETGSAQALNVFKVAALGVSTETSTAQAVTVVKQPTLGIAEETSANPRPPIIHSVALDVSTAADSALALSVAQTLALELASETDAAQAVAALKALTLPLATESDEARALQAPLYLTLTPAEESDTAQPLTAVKNLVLSIATSTDAAQNVMVPHILTLPIATESDLAKELEELPEEPTEGELQEFLSRRKRIVNQ